MSIKRGFETWQEIVRAVIEQWLILKNAILNKAASGNLKKINTKFWKKMENQNARLLSNERTFDLSRQWVTSCFAIKCGKKFITQNYQTVYQKMAYLREIGTTVRNFLTQTIGAMIIHGTLLKHYIRIQWYRGESYIWHSCLWLANFT